jgi:hypothetical protein
MPMAAMLAASASISAFTCGILRTFFGDFFNLLIGTKITFLGRRGFLSLAYDLSQWWREFSAESAHEPLPVGETG